MEDELTPGEALRQIGDVNRRARQPVRTAGALFLVLGFATIAYWPVMSLGPGWSQAVAGVSWATLAVVFFLHLSRMRVQDREVTRANSLTGPVTIAYVIAFSAAFVFGTFLRPENPGAGWVAVLVTLSVCASVPAFYAAWRVLWAER